jgi:hypothetical protein
MVVPIVLSQTEKGEAKAQACDMAWSIKGNVKNIFLPPPEARV